MKNLKNVIVKSLCAVLLVGAVMLPLSASFDLSSDVILAGAKDDVGGEFV